MGMFEGGDQPAMVKVLRSSILSVLVLSSRELQISLVFSADCGASSVADFGSIGFCPKFDKILVLWLLLRAFHEPGRFVGQRRPAGRCRL